MLQAVQRTAVAAVLMVLVMGALGAQAGAADPRLPPERACGKLARTPITGIFATAVSCREARRIASVHAASVRRNGSCFTKRNGCDIGRFRCLYVWRPEIANRVLCGWRGDQKVLLVYRARKSA